MTDENRYTLIFRYENTQYRYDFCYTKESFMILPSRMGELNPKFNNYIFDILCSMEIHTVFTMRTLRLNKRIEKIWLSQPSGIDHIKFTRNGISYNAVIINYATGADVYSFKKLPIIEAKSKPIHLYNIARVFGKTQIHMLQPLDDEEIQLANTFYALKYTLSPEQIYDFKNAIQSYDLTTSENSEADDFIPFRYCLNQNFIDWSYEIMQGNRNSKNKFLRVYGELCYQIVENYRFTIELFYQNGMLPFLENAINKRTIIWICRTYKYESAKEIITFIIKSLMICDTNILQYANNSDHGEFSRIIRNIAKLDDIVIEDPHNSHTILKKECNYTYLITYDLIVKSENRLVLQLGNYSTRDIIMGIKRALY